MRINNVKVTYAQCALYVNGVHDRVEVSGQFIPFGSAVTDITGSARDVSNSQKALESFVYRHRRKLIDLLKAGLERDLVIRGGQWLFYRQYVTKCLNDLNLICYN